jgi:hypothetical protein
MVYDGGELDQAWTQPVTHVLPRTTAGRALNPLQRLGKFREGLVGVRGFEPPQQGNAPESTGAGRTDQGADVDAAPCANRNSFDSLSR